MLVTLLLGIAVAAACAMVFVFPRVRDRVGRNIAETTSPPITYLAEELAEAGREHGTYQPVLERAQRRAGIGVDIVRRDTLTLDTATAEALDRGEVVQTQHFLRSVMYARIDGTGDLVRVGPINPVHPFGEGRGLALLLLFIGGLCGGVFLLVEPLRRRLAALARVTAAFGRGDLSARARRGPRDAIDDLGRSFNHMADEIQRLVAAQQGLLRMVSHELRTPMQRLHFNVERVRDASDDEAREQALDRMARDLDELDELIEELLTYVRLKDQAPARSERVDAGPVVDDVCAGLSPLGGVVTMTVAARADEPLPVAVEARSLRRAVSNLVTNALRHARARVVVRVERDGDGVRIDVDDDGPGVPPEAREQVFEPFRRLDDARTRGTRGFGLGLAIVRRIAEQNGGTIVVLVSDLGGARFRLTLPGLTPPDT